VKRTRIYWVLGSILLMSLLPREAAAQEPSARFRTANEKASLSKWDGAIEEYTRLAETGVLAPALYWNWSQTAAARGTKGEALWALLRAQELAPRDSSIYRDIDRIRAELGLDPSEVSLGLLGEWRALARRFRLDAVALALMLASLAAAVLRRPSVSLGCFILGSIVLSPFLAAPWRETRGVVIQKDAPLIDGPSTEAVALANLREGEVVPILGEEGEYVKIQDASGARGFAHKNDVRKIGVN